MNTIQPDLFEYGIANTTNLKNEIYKLRESVFKEKQNYLLNQDSDNPGVDVFDECSYLFYAKHQDRVIGSCRLTPLRNNKCELDGILPHSVFNLDPLKYIYFSRVAIDAAYRNNNIHEFLFYHFSKWLLTHSEYENYFSLCIPPLLKLYNKYEIIKSNPELIKIPARNNREYYLVEGNIKITHEKISQLLIKQNNYGKQLNFS